MASPAAAATHAPPEWAAERAELKERIAQLEQQLAWFQRQLFGEKSERRPLAPPPEQLSLGEVLAPVPASEPARRIKPGPKCQNVIGIQRGGQGRKAHLRADRLDHPTQAFGFRSG